jgi:hypothetical protein
LPEAGIFPEIDLCKQEIEHARLTLPQNRNCIAAGPACIRKCQWTSHHSPAQGELLYFLNNTSDALKF